MKTIVLFSFLWIATAGTVFSQAVPADAIEGSWLTASGNAMVKIYKEGGVYNGKIAWLKNPLDETGKPKTDKNNPDPAKRAAPLLGLNLLNGFIFKNGQWEDGTIYDPNNGKTYSCRARYRDGKLDLRGYVGITLMGRTQTWYKAEATKH